MRQPTAEERQEFEAMCERLFGWTDFGRTATGNRYANRLVQIAWETHLAERAENCTICN